MWSWGTCAALWTDTMIAWNAMIVASLIVPGGIPAAIVGSMAFGALTGGMYLYGCQ